MASSVISYVTPVKQYILNSSQGSLNSSQDSNTSAKLDLSGYQTSPATTPVGRDNKAGWYEIHKQHVSLCRRPGTEYILCGDSIIAGLSRYPRIWRKFFQPLNALNCGIGGDRTQHVLWRAENLTIPKTTKFVVLHCGTNNIDRDTPSCIANGILSVAVTFQDKVSDLNVLVTGLLPRDQTESFRREKIRKVNKILKKMCRTKFEGIHFMKQDDDWVQEDGLLDESLYYGDFLHLIEEGNEKFATSITAALEKVKENGKLEYSSNEESESDDNEVEYHRQIAQRRNRFRESDGDDYHHWSRRRRIRHSDEHHRRSRVSSSSSRRSKHRRHTSSPKRYRSRSRSPLRNRSRSRDRSRSKDRSSSRDRSRSKDRSKSRERSDERDCRKKKSKWRQAREESSSKLKQMKEEDKEEEAGGKKQKKKKKGVEDEKPGATDGPLSGTAKSIDISALDQKKRLEARRNKFAIPTINPSALILKIKASQSEARKDIETQKLQKRKIEITESSQPKDIKKFFSDYTADSDSE